MRFKSSSVHMVDGLDTHPRVDWDFQTRGMGNKTLDYIPEIIRTRICIPSQCLEGGWVYCGKPPFWQVFRCIGCRDYFIFDFNHPKWCSFYPHCWNCIGSLKWNKCPIPGHSWPEPGRPYVEPKGLNPTKFSQQELDDILGADFEF